MVSVVRGWWLSPHVFTGGEFENNVRSWLRRIAREVPVDDPSSHRNKY